MMAEFLKFSTFSYGISVYINRNYITDFCYDQATNRTVISLPGIENYYEVAGDQTQKILEGDTEDGV
jgi:hypothetical protein